MRSIVAILSLLILLAVAWFGYQEFLRKPAPYDGQGNTYRLRINEQAKRAEVEADLWQTSDLLSMFDVSAVPGLPNGHVDLVENLKVRNLQGETLRLRDLGQGDYSIRGGQRLHLSYSVRLEHDRYEWPAGLEEVAYHTEEGLLVGGSRLFFADGESQLQGPIEVEISLPPGWLAHTPWLAEEKANGLVFSPNSRRELLSNVMFLGTAFAETVEIGGVRLELVLGQRYVANKALFVDLLRAQLQHYRELFGATPLADRYLIVINQGDSGDGGAFAGSFSQFIKGDVDEINRVNWGYVMAHELLHFWNGLSLVPADYREEWFKEGVTDYLTIVALSKRGMIDETILFKRLENIPRRYLMARMLQGLNMSVREAGKDKQPNRLLVYGGGSLAAMALDVELRRLTDDRVGLPQLMADLFAQFGKPGATYAFEDIRNSANRLSGYDLSEFFARTVEGGDYFDINPTFAAMGLRLDSFVEEMYVNHDPAAGAVEQQRYRDIFAPTVTALSTQDTLSPEHSIVD